MLRSTLFARATPILWSEIIRKTGTSRLGVRFIELEHGYARQRCQQARRGVRFAPSVQNLADFFVAIQSLRHQADYDPDKIFTRRETLAAVTEANAYITAFRAVPAQQRRAFAVYILMRERQD